MPNQVVTASELHHGADARAGVPYRVGVACWRAGLVAFSLALVMGCGDSSNSRGTTVANGVTPLPSNGGQPNTSSPGNAASAAGQGGSGSPNEGLVTPGRETPMPGVGLDNPEQDPTPASVNETDAGTEAAAPLPEPPDFAPCPTDGTPCAIMPLGDSISFGIGSSGGGYRVELFRQALADERQITFVGTAPPNGPANVDGQPFPRSHQGHSGFTISGGGAGSLAGLVDAAIAATDPNIILLMIGTNDINGNLNVGNAPARLGALLDQITEDAPDALLMVAQIVPTTNADTNTRVQAYNAAIPALVQQRADAGRHVLLVDMFAPFVDTPNFGAALMNDFLHPNDAGYVVMGQTWYDALASFLPQ